MYLSYSKHASDKLKLILETTRLNFVKVYVVDGDGTLFSPIQKTKATVTENGEILSNRESVELTDFEINGNAVSKGIHVHAGHVSPSCNHREIVVPVEVQAADFVGCDSSQSHAVFSKISVNKEILQNIVAQEMDRRKSRGEALSNSDYYDQINFDDDEDEDDDFEEDDDDDDECPYCGDFGCDGECEDDDDDEDWDDEDEEDDDFDDFEYEDDCDDEDEEEYEDDE